MSDPDPLFEQEPPDFRLIILRTCLSASSAFFSSLIVICYARFPQLRSWESWLILNICVCNTVRFMATSFFHTRYLDAQWGVDFGACFAQASIAELFAYAVFLWGSCLAYDQYQVHFGGRVTPNQNRLRVKYFASVWLASLCLVSLSWSLSGAYPDRPVLGDNSLDLCVVNEDLPWDFEIVAIALYYTPCLLCVAYNWSVFFLIKKRRKSQQETMDQPLLEMTTTSSSATSSDLDVLTEASRFSYFLTPLAMEGLTLVLEAFLFCFRKLYFPTEWNGQRLPAAHEAVLIVQWIFQYSYGAINFCFYSLLETVFDLDDAAEVLRHSESRAFLFKFAAAHYCAENVEFWEQVQSYRTVADVRAVAVAEARKIVHTFVADSGPKALNLPGGARQKVMARLVALESGSGTTDPGLLDDALVTVVGSIQSDIFPRFQRSAEFRDMVLFYKKTRASHGRSLFSRFMSFKRR